MPNEERPQDFELMELLIREAAASTSVQQSSGVDESFRARFQSYIDQIPSYMHSIEKKGFFPHFFFGSFSTLLDTEIAEKLDIEKICFSFDGPQTLKVAVIKKGEIKNKADAIDKVRLFVISEQGAKIATQRFSYGELRDALGRSDPGRFRAVFDNQDELKVKLVTINKDKINQQGVSVVVADKKLHEDNASRDKFKEVEKGLWNKPEDEIAKLAGSNKERVKEYFSEVLKKVSEIHSKYENSLSYAKGAREAAHHGFIAGALNNFRYRHNLRVYLEQFAGRGYADIVLLARGPDRALDSIPVIIELKAATPEELKKLKKGETIERSNTTPTKALEQAREYTKGFQPNVMRVLTTADDILCVGVNFDYPYPISDVEAKSRETEVVPLFQDMLESTDRLSRGGINAEELKTRIQDNIERVYNTFPGTSEKGDNHYFSRALLGQSLLLNEVEVLGTEFEKHVFIYGENIPTETHVESSRPQRPAGQQAKDKMSTGLDKSHAVVSMVLIPKNDEKLVYVVNVVEADGRDEILRKGVPLDNLNQKIGNRKIAELNLNFNVKKQKSDFKEYFNIEANEYASLEQYNNKRTDKFQGTFENVPYPNGLKETFDRVLNSQLTSAQSSSIGEYNELFEKLGEAIFPFKSLVNGENDFQGVLDGAFSHYSDLRLQESPETRALVLTEFQTGRGKRIDMLVHGIKFVDQGNAKEYTPVGLELKGPRGKISADALKKEANEQITKEYERGVTYKTLTDGDEVKFIGVVFDKKASDANSLISASRTSEEGFIPVKVVHSSTQVLPTIDRLDLSSCLGQGNRKKRSAGECLFSWDDVKKFSKGKVDESNVDKIIIDSEKFLTYVKSSQNEEKNAQLIEFIGNKNIEGDYKHLVDKVIEDQGYEHYIQNERIKDLYGDVLQQNSDLTKNPKLKSRLMNAAGGIQLIRGIHGAVVSCKDGTVPDCGLNIGGIVWSFASQPIENVMVKITPKLVKQAESVAGKVIPGTLGKQTKFAIRVIGVKFGTTVAKGVAGALAGAFDIVDIGMSASNLVDCKKRENSDNPCGEKEIRDNIASISFSGASFVSGVALTAASMPGIGIAVGAGLMVGYGVYSGVSNIIEYEKKYDTTHDENWRIFWHTFAFQPTPVDVQHLAAKQNIVNSLAQVTMEVLSNNPNIFAYGVGLGKVINNALHPSNAKIIMDRDNADTTSLSRVIPDSIPNANTNPHK